MIIIEYFSYQNRFNSRIINSIIKSFQLWSFHYKTKCSINLLKIRYTMLIKNILNNGSLTEIQIKKSMSCFFSTLTSNGLHGRKHGSIRIVWQKYRTIQNSYRRISSRSYEPSRDYNYRASGTSWARQVSEHEFTLFFNDAAWNEICAYKNFVAVDVNWYSDNKVLVSNRCKKRAN